MFALRYYITTVTVFAAVAMMKGMELQCSHSVTT